MGEDVGFGRVQERRSVYELLGALRIWAEGTRVRGHRMLEVLEGKGDRKSVV